MMYKSEGLTLLYGTPQTPALEGDQAEISDLSITVLLQPASPSNAVTVRYRVDGGPIKHLRAIAGQTDYKQNTQCFRATFPQLSAGKLVDYSIIGSCAGRQVIDAASFDDFPHSFRIPPIATKSESLTPEQDSRPRHQEPRRHDLKGEFLARFTIAIEAPRISGPTPEGIRVTWNVRTGNVTGPKLNGKLVQGADWMLIRTDGIARIDVGALLETADGARIMINYSGIIDLGEDGYHQFLTNNLHRRVQVWTMPFFFTGDEAYKWLNRRQCMAVGEVSIDDLICVYDVYQLVF